MKAMNGFEAVRINRNNKIINGLTLRVILKDNLL